MLFENVNLFSLFFYFFFCTVQDIVLVIFLLGFLVSSPLLKIQKKLTQCKCL